MPYLSSAERSALERDSLRRDDDDRALRRIAGMSPDQRREAIRAAVAELRSALDLGELCRIVDLAATLGALNSATVAVNWRERDALHKAATPRSWPPALPDGAAIIYEQYAGKRFQGVACLKDEPVYNSMSCRYEHMARYVGEIDGQMVAVPAVHIDWCSIEIREGAK